MTCDYGRTYGKVAAEEIEGDSQWLYIREDNLLPLVERSDLRAHATRQLATQLRSHQRARRRRTTSPPGRHPGQLGHGNLGITSIFLQGIDSSEIIDTVHARRAPMIPASAGSRALL